MKIYPFVGYGTFITKGIWVNKLNVEVCKVQNFIRIFPEKTWFPYALPLKGSSFRALKFDVLEEDVCTLDDYEGIQEGLFKRIIAGIRLKNDKSSSAYLYVPTENTIKLKKLTPELDKIDRWKEEIKKVEEVVKHFPELFL